MLQSEKVLKFNKTLILNRATTFIFNRLFGSYIIAKGIKAASFFEILPNQRFAAGQNFKKDLADSPARSCEFTKQSCGIRPNRSCRN